MDYHVFRLLQPEELTAVVSSVSQQSFADGKSTAHGMAREVKNNLQIDRTGPEWSDADRILISALQRHPEFQSFACPKRILAPMYSRYDTGMEYGSHVDNGVMPSKNGDPLRTDLAMTIFLSDPSTYDGGELVLEMPVGEQEIKLDAGEAVVYSASSIHHVNAVTRGARLAAITWVQSTIRSEEIRGILFDLNRALEKSKASGDRQLSLLITKSYHNLLRYAAEP